ncbi:MAG: hypothetical protein AAF543_06950 [Pseudomonadota bacterium]
MIAPMLDTQALGMSAPAATLAGLYAAIALLLLSLHLRSHWPWTVKSTVIGLALPAAVGTFLAIEAQLGWPSRTPLPSQFQLHAALIEEPAAGERERGAIYLWLTPWEEIDGDQVGTVSDAAVDAAPRTHPRAFDLPYSRDLHQKVDAMQERLARGEMVMGRQQRRSGTERRFGEQKGMIDLLSPPPTSLPSKDGS